MKRHDIDPAPQRAGPGWAQFLRSQAEAILALDLFTVDLLDGTKAYVLAAIEHATRRIRILGATAHPGGQWIVQQARNLCMDLDQAGANVKFVLHDRDAIFHEGFDTVFTAAGLRIVRSGVRVPRMNSIMERWIGGCRRELLDRTLIWNLPHLRRILAACERHHNDHRPHMALSSAAPLKPLPAEITDLEAFRVRRRDRAGGVIHGWHGGDKFRHLQPSNSERAWPSRAPGIRITATWPGAARAAPGRQVADAQGLGPGTAIPSSLDRTACKAGSAQAERGAPPSGSTPGWRSRRRRSTSACSRLLSSSTAVSSLVRKARSCSGRSGSPPLSMCRTAVATPTRSAPRSAKGSGLRSLALADQAEQEVFGADVVAAEPFGFTVGRFQVSHCPEDQSSATPQAGLRLAKEA